MECLAKYYNEKMNGTVNELLSHQRWIRNCMKNTKILSEKKSGNKVSQNVELLNKFLNRLLGASITTQGNVLQSLNECMEALIEIKKREGTYNVGICGKPPKFDLNFYGKTYQM